MNVFVGIVKTDSCDKYVTVHRSRPSSTALVEAVWKNEQAENLQWYLETCSVEIFETKIEE